MNEKGYNDLSFQYFMHIVFFPEKSKGENQKIFERLLTNLCIISLRTFLTCPIKMAKTNTPLSHAKVMNTYSSSFSGFGFFPILVAVLVAK